MSFRFDATAEKFGPAEKEIRLAANPPGKKLRSPLNFVSADFQR